MTNHPDKTHAREVRQMFTRIARRYDRANRWMTWGQDLGWRRQVLRLAEMPLGGRLLDIGAGTGDLSLLAHELDPSLQVVAADFTPAMMHLGRSRRGGGELRWLNADALTLPFPSGSFDGVVSGYLLRNVSDVQQALREQLRVLVPGGRMVCLDASPPPQDVWHLPTRIYLRYILPLLGGLVAGDVRSYRYLPSSTERFLPAEGLAERMRQAGFRQVEYCRFMGGAMAMHWGMK